VDRHEEKPNVSYGVSLYSKKSYINLKFAFCPLSVFVLRVVFSTNKIHYSVCNINSMVF